MPVHKSLRLWASPPIIGRIAPMRMIDAIETETETRRLMAAAPGHPQLTRWAAYAGLGETRPCPWLLQTKSTVIIDTSLPPRIVGGAHPVQRNSPTITIITAVENSLDTELSAPGRGQCHLRQPQNQQQQQHGALRSASRQPTHQHALLHRRLGTKAMGGPPVIATGIINKDLLSLTVLRDIVSSSRIMRLSLCLCHQLSLL